MEYVTAYGPKKRVVINFPEMGRARQEFKEQCDINNILKRFIRTGNLDHVKEHGPRYGFATSDDFHTAMNVVAEANSMFNELPAKTRKFFHNDPAEFLDFVQEEENEEKLVEMGLAKRRPLPAEPAPMPANEGGPAEPGTPEKDPRPGASPRPKE